MLARSWMAILVGVGLTFAGCGGESSEEIDEVGAGLSGSGTPAESVALSVEEIKQLNETLQCQPGEVVCDGSSVVECAGNGAPQVLKECPANQACVEGACAEMPACTKAVCEYDGAYCPDDYPACPYGIQVGDIVENATLLDPVSKDSFRLGTHYKESGILVLIAANGW